MPYAPERIKMPSPDVSGVKEQWRRATQPNFDWLEMAKALYSTVGLFDQPGMGFAQPIGTISGAGTKAGAAKNLWKKTEEFADSVLKALKDREFLLRSLRKKETYGPLSVREKSQIQNIRNEIAKYYEARQLKPSEDYLHFNKLTDEGIATFHGEFPPKNFPW